MPWGREPQTSETEVCATTTLVVIGAWVVYAGAMSRLRRPFLADRFFFVTVRLLPCRRELQEADWHSLALALRRARQIHSFFLTAWVFLPDHWHAICAVKAPLTISQVMKSIKTSSTILINRRRGETGELWQGRFFDRALRTIEEYQEKMEYVHGNPVKVGLVERPQEWKWSSLREYSGVSAAEQEQVCGLTIDRIRVPVDLRTRI